MSLTHNDKYYNGIAFREDLRQAFEAKQEEQPQNRTDSTDNGLHSDPTPNDSSERDPVGGPEEDSYDGGYNLADLEGWLDMEELDHLAL